VNFALFTLFMIAPLLALIDARRATNEQWDAIRQKRLFWMVGILVSVLVSPLSGTITGVFYLWKIRPRLAAA
jgi:hypothetical protein